MLRVDSDGADLRRRRFGSTAIRCPDACQVPEHPSLAAKAGDVLLHLGVVALQSLEELLDRVFGNQLGQGQRLDPDVLERKRKPDFPRENKRLASDIDAREIL